VGVVGRDGEVTAVGDAVKRVAGGDGREVVVVSGEAGLGKTTLVADSARAAFDDGACVLFGHCEEDLATPYQLFAEALGHYVTYAPEEQLRAHVEAYGSELSRLVPALASRIPDLPPSRATDSDTERFLLFAAVVGLLAMMSEAQPVVLVLDDLQWADKGSLLLLRHLASADRPMRVLVLGTYRDSELSRTHPLTDILAALHRLNGVSRIELAGLDDAGVASFLEAAAGGSLDDAAVGLAHAIYLETDGNPFFVGEVLRHLSETGVIHQDDAGRWVAADTLEQVALPDSVRTVIGARVGRLGADAERVLSVAAVIGRDFDLDLLARATTTDDDDLLDILEAASAAALVREPADATGRYNFAHALIQHTLYEDMGPNRRARTHRHVAEALEDLCGNRHGSRVEELARHWVSATQPMDLAKAIDYSRQAGDAALAALAPADALRYYAQALELHPQDPDADPVVGLDLAIGLGTAQRQTGDPEYVATLADAALSAFERGDDGRLVAAIIARDRGYTSTAGRVDDELVSFLERALGRLTSPDRSRALLLATLCSELAYCPPLDRRIALADEALGLIRTTGDGADLVWVINHVFDALMVPELLGDRLALSSEALEVAERLGDPITLFWAAQYRCIASVGTGDVVEMDRCLAIAQEIADRLALPELRWNWGFTAATRALLAGDLSRAEELLAQWHAIAAESGQPDAEAFFLVQTASIATMRGDMEPLMPVLEALLAEYPDHSALLSLMAKVYVLSGRVDEARPLLDRYAPQLSVLPRDIVWLGGMLNWSSTVVACGRTDLASGMYEQLEPWADQACASGMLVYHGPVSHALAELATVLGRHDDADRFFADAHDMNARMGARFWTTWTDTAWAKLLAARGGPGDAERARALLVEAHGVASASGYHIVERDAETALQRLG
jgi:tetratricopeptide (TPR) repeat protein